MMVFYITVIKRIAADTQRQKNHPHFKEYIVNDINSEQGKTA